MKVTCVVLTTKTLVKASVMHEQHLMEREVVTIRYSFEEHLASETDSSTYVEVTIDWLQLEVPKID